MPAAVPACRASLKDHMLARYYAALVGVATGQVAARTRHGGGAEGLLQLLREVPFMRTVLSAHAAATGHGLAANLASARIRGKHADCAAKHSSLLSRCFGGDVEQVVPPAGSQRWSRAETLAALREMGVDTSAAELEEEEASVASDSDCSSALRRNDASCDQAQQHVVAWPTVQLHRSDSTQQAAQQPSGGCMDDGSSRDCIVQVQQAQGQNSAGGVDFVHSAPQQS